MTHADDEATEACLIYNRIAFRLLYGEKMSEAIRKEVAHTRYEPLLTIEPSCPPDGYVVNTMSWVLFIGCCAVNCLKTSSFQRRIWARIAIRLRPCRGIERLGSWISPTAKPFYGKDCLCR